MARTIPATEVVLVAGNHDQSIRETKIINAALVDNDYELVNPVVEVTL